VAAALGALLLVLAAATPARPAPSPADGKAAVSLEGPQPIRYLDERKKGKDEDDQPEQGFGFLLKSRKGTQSVTVRIDLGSLDGLARVSKLSKHCDRDGEQIECSYRAKESGTAVKPFEIGAADGSKAGDRAKLTVTAAAESASGSSHEATAKRTTEFVVGVPRLEVTGKFAKDRQDPGGTARLRLNVRASGPVRAENGVGLTVNPGVHVGPSPLYRNCGADDANDTIICHLEGRAPAPGETATVDHPIDFHIPTHMLYSEFDFHAYAIGGPSDPDLNPGGSYRTERKRWNDWRDGKSDAPTAGLRPGETKGLGTFEKYKRIWVEVDQYVDVAAVGKEIRGAEGETVEAPISVREHWPDGSVAKNALHLAYTYRFTAPEGTTVVAVPDDEGEPMCEVRHQRTVSCPQGMGGERIKLRIDRKVPGAEGRVEIIHAKKFPANDPDRSDDADAVPLHVAGVTTELRARRLASATLPWAIGGTVLLAAAGTAYWLRHRHQGAGG
jgi:hypothetical protein